VAERIGMTDMGVNHHFGTREALLEVLLHEMALRTRQELAEFSAQWLRDGAQLSTLVAFLSGFYTAGHTQLALALYEAGYHDRGRPFLAPVVQALHIARQRRLGPKVDVDETRLAVAAMHQALALDPLFGSEFRRSAGLTGQKANDSTPTRQWWLATMAQRLGIPP
jgi:AcrR family transcriptional regulator